MRIIAGEMRSRKLKAPEGMDTRPTADRVKEALFSILQSRLFGARVLDLYGGSGALALEAISRGASSAVIADQSPKACQIIAENIESLRVGGKAALLRMKDTQALKALHGQGCAFDLIFLDPPYRMETESVCGLIQEYGLLKKDGMLVIEHSRSRRPALPAPYIETDHREYGAAGLTFFALQETEEA